MPEVHQIAAGVPRDNIGEGLVHSSQRELLRKRPGKAAQGSSTFPCKTRARKEPRSRFTPPAGRSQNKCHSILLTLPLTNIEGDFDHFKRGYDRFSAPMEIRRGESNAQSCRVRCGSCRIFTNAAASPCSDRSV